MPHCYRCQLCSYSSRTSSQLTVHLRTHTGDAPFNCPYCSRKFKIKSDMRRHLLIHTGEKPFKCSLCETRCTTRGRNFNLKRWRNALFKEKTVEKIYGMLHNKRGQIHVGLFSAQLCINCTLETLHAAWVGWGQNLGQKCLYCT